MAFNLCKYTKSRLLNHETRWAPEANYVATELTDKKASANPTKTFFVKMITKDILLEDSILDLIDNSVDGAWRSEGSRPMGLSEGADLSEYSISITLSPTSFRIIDNYGGMTLDDAVNHAFSFGRQATETNEDYSIGVYGIGMKRAVFKLGTDIKIRSTFSDENKQRVAFAVPINVQTWVTNDAPPWDFDIESDEPLEQDGVEIVANGLTPGAVRSFESPSFLQNLRRTIARDYTLHMHRGLKISINGSLVVGAQIELRASEDFTPMHVEYKDETEGMEVSIEIIGGMLAPPPDSSEPDEKADSENSFGWYVGCNGRIVLAADKTSVAGWGVDGWPAWHPQYAGFLGLVLFTAANPAALPLTTTKRNVDTASEIYRRARPRMRDLTRKWIDYTNARKQAPDEAKAKEKDAALVSIYQLQKVDAVKLPALTARSAPAPANVHYAVPVTRMKKLAKALGSINLAYREVGLKSFDYTYNDLVGEE